MTRTAYCIAFAAIISTTLLTAPVAADWPHDQLTYKGYKRDLYYRNFYCGGRYRPNGCEHYRYRRWKARQVPYTSDDVHCHGVIPATGDQAQSTKGATENAIMAWQGRVRFRFGERYIDIKYAKGPNGKSEPEIVCSQSSVPDAIRDKTNPTLYRCELSARPCRAAPKKLR